jgi:spore coat protein U-like protein
MKQISHLALLIELFKNAGDTQEWNNNNNLFSGLGSGSVEAIPVIANIKVRPTFEQVNISTRLLLQ